MVAFKENATSDVMASGSVRTAPEPTVRLSLSALNTRPKPKKLQDWCGNENNRRDWNTIQYDRSFQTCLVDLNIPQFRQKPTVNTESGAHDQSNVNGQANVA